MVSGLFNRIPNYCSAIQEGIRLRLRAIRCAAATRTARTPAGRSYSLGATREHFGFPVNAALATGIDPATGTPKIPSRSGALRETCRMPMCMSGRWTYNMLCRTTWSRRWDIRRERHKLIRIVNQEFLIRKTRGFSEYISTTGCEFQLQCAECAPDSPVARGLQVDAGYRFSKSIDTLSYEGPGAETNQTFHRILRFERGLVRLRRDSLLRCIWRVGDTFSTQPGRI